MHCYIKLEGEFDCISKVSINPIKGNWFGLALAKSDYTEVQKTENIYHSYSCQRPILHRTDV